MRLTLDHVRKPIFALMAAAVWFALSSPASAAGCPTTPVAEHGGQHQCFSAGGSKGHVHLWKSDSFDATKDAATVVYVHGHNIDNKSQKPHYIDWAWDNHGLARQFAASGKNALFVAIEAAHDREDPIKWFSLSDLLTSIENNAGIVPPRHVMAMGHSGGFYTTLQWLNDSNLKHVVVLDSGKTSKAPLKGFYEKGGRVTLAGGSWQNSWMKDFAKDYTSGSLAFTTMQGYGSAAPVEAQGVHFDSTLGHMAVVTGGDAIGKSLARLNVGGGSTGTASRTFKRLPLNVPELEVPIPYVEFTKNLTEGGPDELVSPWIGEYAAGVYRFLLSIVGVVAGVFILIGGYGYLTAGGSAQRTAAAKNRIVNALTGLVLALGSYVILNTINPDLVNFKALRFQSVSHVPVDFANYSDPGNDAPPGPIDISAAGFASGAKAFCRSKSACETFCRGLSKDRSQWPKATTGYMPRSNTIKVPDHKVNDRVVLDGRGYAHKTVVQALIQTAEQMAKDYPGRNLQIKVSECHRTLESQIAKVCDPGVGVIKGKDVGSAVAWPGGSNHGVGYACDLRLLDNGKNLIWGGTKGQCSVPVENSKLFDTIMFKMGWVRYNREVWHYEFGTPKSVGNRCGGLNNERGDCSYPPAHYCK